MLFDHIRNNKPYNQVELGVSATMTAILGRMATYSGKVVTWDQAFDSETLALARTDCLGRPSARPARRRRPLSGRHAGRDAGVLRIMRHLAQSFKNSSMPMSVSG